MLRDALTQVQDLALGPVEPHDICTDLLWGGKIREKRWNSQSDYL